MTDLLIDPDVESVVIDYLNEWLPLFSAETANASDKTHEGRCVRVIKTGGFGRLSVVLGRYQLTFDSYDVSETKADELSRRVAALVLNLEGSIHDGVTFSAVNELGASQNFPDPLDERPRYSQSFVLHAKVQSITI